jgi:hypothetical protein
MPVLKPYTPSGVYLVPVSQMTKKRAVRVFLLLWVAAVALVGGGCSGINASRSVSPLDFLIPGGFMHMQNSAPAPISPESTNSVAKLAQVR